MSDLYIQKSDYRLSLFQDKVIVRDASSCIIKEIGLSKLENILIFGDAQLSTQLIKRCLKEEIGIYYFTKVGKFLGSLYPYRTDDYQKQLLQLKVCQDPESCLSLAKTVLCEKISLQRQLLEAYDRFDLLDQTDYARMDDLLWQAGQAMSIAELMGYEGRMAKTYFYYLGLLVPKEFKFSGRSKRPARDRFNALLNFGYSILHSYFIGYIRKSGLSPGIGFLHKSRPHHATLASDLMEAWRPLMVDDTIMQLVMSEELGVEHFEEDEEKGYLLTAEGRKVFLTRLRSRFLEIHEYVELDKKRYTFPYMVEKQLLSLQQVFKYRDTSLYLGIEGGDGDDEVF